MTSFSENFIWGAASAAYQIEGAAGTDGKGPSVWDTFSRRPGAMWQGQTADIACDHYHLYKQDVDLMSQIGLNAYRLSISWPRVLSEGTGRVNEKGLDFYDRLIDELLLHKIDPFVSLFHWDYPYELYCRGGWLNQQSPEWFAEYTRVVVERLSDRVSNWITLNEPNCFVGYGHIDGNMAPGLKLDQPDIFRIAHNVLLSHGRAVKTIREHAKLPCKVGMAPALIARIPASDSPQDIEAARRATFSVDSVEPDRICSKFIGQPNYYWFDPVFLGRYPDEVIQYYGKAFPDFSDKDMSIISEPLDFLGINIYHGRYRRMSDQGEPEIILDSLGEPLNMMSAPVTPDALYWGPKFFYERYKKPIIITENGLANMDWVSSDGRVHDPQRIDFMHRYLKSLSRAVSEGVDVQGYFHWSLMDNFEWNDGYTKRFGLIFVDYNTQQRIIKDSGYWYKKLIASNGDL